MTLMDVRFVAHCGLKSDIVGGPKVPKAEMRCRLYFRSKTFLDFRFLLKQGERTKHEEHDLVRRARRTQNSDSICARRTSASSSVSIAETLRPPVQRLRRNCVAPTLTMQELLAAKVGTLNERLTFLHNR
jgi:hypothetical protein